MMLLLAVGQLGLTACGSAVSTSSEEILTVTDGNAESEVINI